MAVRSCFELPTVVGNCLHSQRTNGHTTTNAICGNMEGTKRAGGAGGTSQVLAEAADGVKESRWGRTSSAVGSDGQECGWTGVISGTGGGRFEPAYSSLGMAERPRTFQTIQPDKTGSLARLHAHSRETLPTTVGCLSPRRPMCIQPGRSSRACDCAPDCKLHRAGFG